MPLLDHFNPPLSLVRSWVSFHSMWCGVLVRRLNRMLPRPRFFAETNMHLGASVAGDVAEFDREPGSGHMGLAMVPSTRPAQLSIEAVFPDDIEVRVMDTRDGARLAAVIELASPGNKDRSEARRSFVDKCAAYLERGIGLMMIDTVTNRPGNLHD
ncbi:MAG: DUF4058 domain-containing protein, partial [Gemmataceae bacterium]|nr:DUF4058 domain-containing protein [Gemmataceae bacterium]